MLKGHVSIISEEQFNEYMNANGNESCSWEHNGTWITGTVNEAWEHALTYGEEADFIDGVAGAIDFE